MLSIGPTLGTRLVISHQTGVRGGNQHGNVADVPRARRHVRDGSRCQRSIGIGHANFVPNQLA